MSRDRVDVTDAGPVIPNSDGVKVIRDCRAWQRLRGLAVAGAASKCTASIIAMCPKIPSVDRRHR